MIGRHFGISAGNWPFLGNSNDISGNANNGTDNDMSYGPDYGIFNGSSSRISLPNSASLKPTVFTIIALYKGNSATNQNILHDYVNSSSKIYGYTFRVSTDGTILLRCAKGTGAVINTDFKQISSVATVNDNVRHFVGATYDNSILKVYVDGRFDSSVDWAAGLAYTTTHYPNIGCRQDTSGTYTDYLNGQLGGLELLPYVLSESDFCRLHSYLRGMLV